MYADPWIAYARAAGAYPPVSGLLSARLSIGRETFRRGLVPPLSRRWRYVWLSDVHARALNLTQRDWHPVELSFEVTERPGEPAGLTITRVERDDFAIRVNYDIVPALDGPAYAPRGEAKDDIGNQYDDVGGAFGPAPDGHGTDGVLSMPLPPPEARTLRIRITWRESEEPVWDRSAHEIRIALPA